MSFPVKEEVTALENEYKIEDSDVMPNTFKFVYEKGHSLLLYFCDKNVYYEEVENDSLNGFELFEKIGKGMHINGMYFETSTTEPGYHGKDAYWKEEGGKVDRKLKSVAIFGEGFDIKFGEGEKYVIEFKRKHYRPTPKKKKPKRRTPSGGNNNGNDHVDRNGGGNNNNDGGGDGGNTTGRKRKPPRDNDSNEPASKKQKV